MVQLAEVSWTDAQRLFSECDTVILPVGSTEQHGPHNPLGTDHLIAAAFSREVGDKTGVPVLPVVPVGISEHHRQFPGTLWVPPSVFRDYMLSVALAACSHGARKVLFFNGHGGNTAALLEVAGALRRDYDVFAAVLMTFPPGVDGHAGAKETSMNLLYHGHLVRMERAVDQAQETRLGTLEMTGIGGLGPLQFPWDTVDLTPTGVLGGAGKRIVSTTASRKTGEEIMRPFTDEVVRVVEAVKAADADGLLSKPHKG